MSCRLGRNRSGTPAYNNMGWTNQLCSFQSTRTNVRSSPGGRPDHLSTVVNRSSVTRFGWSPVAAESDAFDPLEPKEIIVGIARLDEAVGV